ncbi:hypothetical protein [Microvirga makkahensis]|uniref:Uncharacterized protein n=1 Tax=Microvirga makkahensis TaxID=1128670 RepID=A0A7X3MNV6_9HYPH|nr:hypothetical protein [Microvirga makkahensis]MXQ10448.1 hypothetical protein [Microvirga makkahensis]
MGNSAQITSLYRALESAAAGRPTAVRDMSPDDRAAYMRAAKRKSRQREKEAAESGRPEPTAAMIREALADAAILILATDAPGGAQVRNILFKAFPGRAGVAGSVTAKARSGKLKPKLLTPERLRGTA